MTVVLETSLGTIKISLETEATPKTVENFLTYLKDGFFEGTIFHRVIDGFVVQGGGLESNMHNKSTLAPIENEADKGLSNKAGTVAMARTNDPHSATSQFFINLADNTFLDHSAKTAEGWGYCAFGQVVEGMDIVKKMAKVATGHRAGHQDVPLEDIVLKSAFVEETTPA